MFEGKRGEETEAEQGKGKINLSQKVTPHWDAGGLACACWEQVIHGLIDFIFNNLWKLFQGEFQPD